MFKRRYLMQFIFIVPVFVFMFIICDMNVSAEHGNCGCVGGSCHTHGNNTDYWHPCHSGKHLPSEIIYGDCAYPGNPHGRQHDGADIDVCGPGSCWVVNTEHYSTGHRFNSYGDGGRAWGDWTALTGALYQGTEITDRNRKLHTQTEIYSQSFARTEYTTESMECTICHAVFGKVPIQTENKTEEQRITLDSDHNYGDSYLTDTLTHDQTQLFARSKIHSINTQTYTSSNRQFVNENVRNFYLYKYCAVCGHVMLDRANTIGVLTYPCTQGSHIVDPVDDYKYTPRPDILSKYTKTFKNFSCAKQGDQIVGSILGMEEGLGESRVQHDKDILLNYIDSGNPDKKSSEPEVETSERDLEELPGKNPDNKLFAAPEIKSKGFYFVAWSNINYTPSMSSKKAGTDVSKTVKTFKTNVRKDFKDEYKHGENAVIYSAGKSITGRELSADFMKIGKSAADVTLHVDPQVDMYAVWHEDYYKVKFHTTIKEEAKDDGAPPNTLNLTNVPFSSDGYVDNKGKTENNNQWYWDTYLFSSYKERKKIPFTRWYTFVGWAVEEGGSAKYCKLEDSGDEDSRDYGEMTTRPEDGDHWVHLWDVWKPKRYTIYYHGDSYDGEVSGMVSKDKKNYHDKTRHPINEDVDLWEPTSAYKKGYYIDHWQAYNHVTEKLVKVPLDYGYKPEGKGDEDDIIKYTIPAFPIGKLDGKDKGYGTINLADCIDPDNNRLDLYPVWKPYTYTVTFKADNGFSGSDLSVTLKYDEELYLFNNTPNLKSYDNESGVKKISAGSTPHFKREGYYVSAWRPAYRDLNANYEATHGSQYLSTGTGYNGSDVAVAACIKVKNLITPGLAKGASNSNHILTAWNHESMFDTKIDLYVHNSAIKYYTKYNNDTTKNEHINNKYDRNVLSDCSGGPTTQTYYYDQVYDIPKLGYTRWNKYGTSEFLGWCYKLGDTSSTPQFASKEESPKDILRLQNISTTVNDKLFKPNASPGVPGDSDKSSGKTAEGTQYSTYFAYLQSGKVQTYNLYAVFDDCPGIEPADMQSMGDDARAMAAQDDSRSKSGKYLESKILWDIPQNVDSIWDREDEASTTHTTRIRLNKNNYYIDRFLDLKWDHPDVNESGIPDVAVYSLRFVVKDRRGHTYTVEKKMYTGEWQSIMTDPRRIGFGLFNRSAFN